jgi:hypothetical protein
MSLKATQFCKRDFTVLVELENGDKHLGDAFAEAVYRARPSRLDNLLDIEVVHKPKSSVHQAVQLVCDRGIRKFTLQTAHPELPVLVTPPSIVEPALSYMSFEYQTGTVVDQWTEMSRCADEADDLMVDIIKLGFLKKVVTNCVWTDDPPKSSLVVVGGKDLET